VPENWQALIDVVGPNKYAQALFIVVLALVAGKIADWILCRALKKVTSRTKMSLDDELIDLFHKPVYQSVVLIGLALATLRLELPRAVEAPTLGVVSTLAVLIWTLLAFRLAHILLELVSSKSEGSQILQARTLPLFENVTRIVIGAGAVYFIFLSWGVDVTAWLAGAGIVGIALGFAAKDTLANLFSGLFILADAPYKIGDYVVLDTGERGRITQIGLRSTRLLTRDDIEITIPNSVIANAKIINESGGPWERERVRVPIGVAYGSDVDRVRAALMEIAAGDERVVTDPEPRVRFRRFGESSLDFELLCWIDTPELRGQVLDALNTEIYKRFQHEQISIPFPQRDLHIKESPRQPG